MLEHLTLGEFVVALLTSLAAVSAIEKVAFGLFLVGTIGFFVWVAVLAVRK